MNNHHAAYNGNLVSTLTKKLAIIVEILQLIADNCIPL